MTESKQNCGMVKSVCSVLTRWPLNSFWLFHLICFDLELSNLTLLCLTSFICQLGVIVYPISEGCCGDITSDNSYKMSGMLNKYVIFYSNSYYFYLQYRVVNLMIHITCLHMPGEFLMNRLFSEKLQLIRYTGTVLF